MARGDALVIGIDPGKRGAAVALDLQGFPIEWIAADHPADGYVKGGVYLTRRMSDWLRDRESVALVVIERQSARPMEGRSSILTTGYGWGLWDGMAGALNLPQESPNPQRWQRELWGGKRVSGEEKKARAIEWCSRRVPDLPLLWARRRKQHDGLADACCLALWGLKQLNRGAP